MLIKLKVKKSDPFLRTWCENLDKAIAYLKRLDNHEIIPKDD